MLSLFFSYAALLVLLKSLALTLFFLLLKHFCVVWSESLFFCDAVLVINIPHSVLVCCVAWNWDKNCFSVQRTGHELLVSWCLKHKNLLSLLFILYACQVYILFFISKKFDKGLCDCATSELFQGSLGDCGCELEKQVFMRSEWCIGTGILSCA